MYKVLKQKSENSAHKKVKLWKKKIGRKKKGLDLNLLEFNFTQKINFNGGCEI